MATIKKRGHSYQFRCYDGYDAEGHQIERTMTWKPLAGMSEKRAEKEAQREAALFEEQVRTGQIAGKRIKFSEFAQKWFEDYAEVQLRPRTVARYRELMERIDPAIGHIHLDKLRPDHLMAFYKQLCEIPKVESVHFTGDFRQTLKKRKMTQDAFAKKADLSLGTVRALVMGKSISHQSAEKIANALKKPAQELFEPDGDGKPLSGKTVLYYHRLISSILHTAVDWQYIPANPAERVKPPKVQQKDALYLDDKQAIELLELLEDVPIQYKTAITVLLFTGMRRGELIGLEWPDIDFETGTISISRSTQYLSGRGVFDDETKTTSSHRVIKAPQSAMQALAEYRRWQMSEKLRIGPIWKNSSKVFVGVDGTPMHPEALSGWFRIFIQGTDLPPIHLHSLRHTNATLQIANGVSVTTVAGTLGHANAATTTKIYAHAIQSAAAASAQMMDELLSPNRRHA